MDSEGQLAEKSAAQVKVCLKNVRNFRPEFQRERLFAFFKINILLREKKVIYIYIIIHLHVSRKLLLLC